MIVHFNDRRAIPAGASFMMGGAAAVSPPRLINADRGGPVPEYPQPSSVAARLVNLIEDPALGEMHRLNLCPSAEFFVHGEELQRGKLGRMLGGDIRRARAVMPLCGDLLPLRAVQIFQI